MAVGISVTIITRNEEKNIQDCLDSVTWAQEIVLVDAESTDRTVEIARQFTPKVLVRPWSGFAAQKNFALARATQPWVLSLDADERVTLPLCERIREIVAADGPLDGYYLPRKNFFGGRWIRHGMWYPDYQLRLFRRNSGSFQYVNVHETMKVEGHLGYLQTPLLHFSYDGIEDFVQRSNVYSTLAAQDLMRRGKRISYRKLLFGPLGRFCAMYFLHR